MTGGRVGSRVGSGVGVGGCLVFAGFTGVGVSVAGGAVVGEGEICCEIVDSGVNEAVGTTLASSFEAEIEISGISLRMRSLPMAAKNRKMISSEYITNVNLRLFIDNTVSSDFQLCGCIFYHSIRICSKLIERQQRS